MKYRFHKHNLLLDLCNIQMEIGCIFKRPFCCPGYRDSQVYYQLTTSTYAKAFFLAWCAMHLKQRWRFWQVALRIIEWAQKIHLLTHCKRRIIKKVDTMNSGKSPVWLSVAAVLSTNQITAKTLKSKSVRSAAILVKPLGNCFIWWEWAYSMKKRCILLGFGI